MKIKQISFATLAFLLSGSINQAYAVDCEQAVTNQISIMLGAIDPSKPGSQMFIKSLSLPKAKQRGVKACKRDSNTPKGLKAWQCASAARNNTQLKACE